jgi:hypothetical protein
MLNNFKVTEPMTPFYLPPRRKGEPAPQLQDVRSLVIVGANGTGKTRMAAWIENNAGEKAHRIAAQRSLVMKANVTPRPLELAQFRLYFGLDNENFSDKSILKNGHRWRGDPAVNPLDDFEEVLILLHAERRKRDGEYAQAARTAIPTTTSPNCNIDTLLDIWHAVMPQRKLSFPADKIEVRTSDGSVYNPGKMSDGERACVYLIGQVLSAPRDGIIIVDEPELHLHRAIQTALWNKLEKSRTDCTFIYVTHDLDFAAERHSARKLWLKQFDGNDWEWDEVPKDIPLPEAMVLEVLGNRRPVLLVEGDSSSYDLQIYQALYPQELVISCQGCRRVVEATRAMRSLPQLHSRSVRGLVDRDRRGEEEVAALRGDGILVADVAEVESLLVIPDALEAVAIQVRAPNVGEAVAAARNAVISELAKMLDQQALARALAEIQFRLNGFGPKIGRSDVAALENALRDYVSEIDVASAFLRCKQLLGDAVSANNYLAVLKLYNCKGIIAFVANSMGLKKEKYAQIVLDLVQEQPDGRLANAMRTTLEQA